MRNVRELSIWTLAALLVIYAIVALSPIKGAIGRSSPKVASLFSPPLFNFSRTYTDGKVLEFSAGMSKREVFSKLMDGYSGKADLIANCVVTTANSVLPITNDLEIANVYGGPDRLCVRLDSRRLIVDFRFQGDVVSSVEVTYVRTESF